MRSDSHYPFYGWLLITGVIVFGMYLLWDFGLVHRLVTEDVTYLSSIICIVFLAVTAYLGLAAWHMSKQVQFVQQLTEVESDDNFEPALNSWAHEHISLVKRGRADTTREGDPLTARLVETVHRGHSTGWFLSDLLLRLGLIGTVIGFVLMLGSVYELDHNDVSALKDLMTTMGGGMRVALYTTLSGLGSALLISIQCQWLDRCADALIGQIIKLSVEMD